MKTIELLEGVRSSVLGFGCAPILGSVDAKTAERAISCALEQGITHFDLARSYGYGEAENFVGRILKSRRNKVVIASKFGIKANWKAGLLKPAKPVVRLVKSLRKKGDNTKSSAPSSLAAAPDKTGIPDRFHDRIALDSTSMRRSLELSLKNLNTDYLDYFFVHEPVESLSHFEDLVASAEQFKSQGKIRAFGLAFMRSQQSLHEKYIGSFDVLQFNNPTNTTDYRECVLERGAQPNILFSPFRGHNALKPSAKLRHLSHDFPRSVILCSMYNEKHIIENCRSIETL